MAIETTTTLAGLNPAWPLGTDPKSEGDDHIRLIKTLLKANFPSTVTADIGFGVRNTPDRWVWNDKIDLTGTDVAVMLDSGQFSTYGSFINLYANAAVGASPAIAFYDTAKVKRGQITRDVTSTNFLLEAFSAAGASLGSGVMWSATNNPFSSTGYQKLQSGWIIQWGSTANGDSTVTFPTTFPTVCAAVVASPFSSALPGTQAQTSIVESLVVTAFVIRNRAISAGAVAVSTGGARWIAIGY